MTFDSGSKLITCSSVPGPLHTAQIIYPKTQATPMSQVRSDVQKSVIETSGLKHSSELPCEQPLPPQGKTGPSILALKFQPLLLQTVGVSTRSAPCKGSAGAAATLQAPTTRGKMFDSGNESQTSAFLPKPVCSNYMEQQHLAALLFSAPQQG